MDENIPTGDNENVPSLPSVAAKSIVPESIEDVNRSTFEYFKRRLGYVAGLFIFVAIYEVVLFSLGVQTLLFYMIPVVLIIPAYQVVVRKIRGEFMMQFADTNGMAYVKDGTTEGLESRLFGIGHDQSVENVVSGQYMNAPIRLFDYRYVTGFGKSSQTHTYTIFELCFDTAMPDILLERTGHAFGESLLGSGSELEQIHLEGDFDKYFTVGVAKGYETNALEVLTPDVMAELIDKAKMFSMEIVGGNLYLYDNKIVSTKKDLDELYALAQHFVEKLGPVLSRMKVE